MSTAALPMDAFPTPIARPTVRLRYNNVFLPEYLSTIVISIVISIPFLVVPVNGAVALQGNSIHAPIGLGLYTVIVALLAQRTFHHRTRHGRVVVLDDPELGIVARSGRETVSLTNLDDCLLTIDRFFGRRVRAIHLRDARGHELVVHDALDGFPEFLRLLRRISGRTPQTTRDYEERHQRIGEAWDERHTVFPLTVEASISRAVIRFFFLIPVAFVEFVGNLALNFQLVAMGHGRYAVYAAPFTLLVAAFVNRYVSYYLLTSRRMNR